MVNMEMESCLIIQSNYSKVNSEFLLRKVNRECCSM